MRQAPTWAPTFVPGLVARQCPHDRLATCFQRRGDAQCAKRRSTAPLAAVPAPMAGVTAPPAAVAALLGYGRRARRRPRVLACS